MRVLFTSIAIRTHLYKAIPLAWACRAAGHEVRVASTPGLTAATVAAGLPAVEVGHGYDTLASLIEGRGGAKVAEPSVTRWSRSGLARGGAGREQPSPQWRAEVRRRLRDEAFVLWVRPAQAMAPDLIGFAERWRPDLVVSDALVLAASLVSATRGVPLVRYIWGPDMMRQIGYPLQGQPSTVDDVREQWPADLVELFDRYGAAPRDDYAVGTVDPWPTSLQLPGTPGRIPMRYVPYNGAAASPDWVLDKPSRPRVCVTWGTTTSTLGGDEAFLLPRVLEAVAPLDVEVVLAVSATDRAKLAGVPDNVRMVQDLPLHLFMPTCAAVVNQAGAGSLLTAACHGVPQVLIPQTADTPYNAANFGTSGAAVVLDAAEAGPDAIAEAVTTALTDDAVRAAAHKVRDELAGAPSPADVVRTLEEIAGR